MKLNFKKFSTSAVVLLIIAVIFTASILATSLLNDVSGDGNVNNDDVIALMQSLTGEKSLPGGISGDINADDKSDVLDVIALKRYVLKFQNIDDGWTIGIY